MQELFEAVRAACSSGVWSRAVELVRRFAVSQAEAPLPEATRLVCRVRSDDRTIPVTVQLYPEDAEWDCDCESRAPCCEHVAAAVIAVKKARAEGKPLPEPMTSAANLGYRLSRYQGELKLERFILRSDGSRLALRVSLSTAVSQHATGLDFAPSEADLQLDRLVADVGLIRPEQILAVLKLLVGHRNVEFEGSSVEVVQEPLRPRATLRDMPGGILVELAPDPSIRAIVASHVAWTGTTLAPLAATEYCGLKYERLVPTRVYGPDELATLVTEDLPELRRWFVVEVQTEQLPEVTKDERPRVVVDLQEKDDQLSALATLVYGDPAIARVEGNRLVHLDGPVPLRKLDLERRALEHLRQSLGLSAGVLKVVAGKDAVQFATKLNHWHGEVTGCDLERWLEQFEQRRQQR